MYLSTNDEKETIEFIRKKNYQRIRDIGQGGLGKTILLKDELIDEYFVCKKYSPVYEDAIVQYFPYFLEEIKILHKLYHPNIVRIFNYYLYPEATTGYILMEYIQGSYIDEFLEANPEKLDDVFRQTIEGFLYLENKSILHRDIRPQNILVDQDGVVKIIDFGFGKFMNFAFENKSISLNWRYAVPSEFRMKIYDSRTELYFIAKLFEEVIGKLGNVEFSYSTILSKMLNFEYEQRIEDFFQISRAIVSGSTMDNSFDYDDKITYSSFANSLKEVISKLPYAVKYNQDLPIIIRRMEELYLNSVLEDNIQNVHKLIGIFIQGNFRYFNKKDFPVWILRGFIKLMKKSTDNNQKIILNNLWERFDSIEKLPIQEDDLPF